jgi:hypothetical protein
MGHGSLPLWLLAGAAHLLGPQLAGAAAGAAQPPCEDFGVPPPPPLPLPLPPPPAALGGAPPALQAALRPLLLLRRCQYLPLPPPQATTQLELCLLQSARIIDKDNFSIFLGYFDRWSGGSGSDREGGSAAHEYTGGNPWSCPGGAERSVTLRIACSGGQERPAITQWKDLGTCHYEAHLLLPGSC